MNYENSFFHILKQVPYVDQEEKFYCHHACLSMMFQYYATDAPLYEVLYHSGIGFSLAGQPRYTIFSNLKKPIFYNCWSGYSLSLGYKDIEFLARLYGLEILDFSYKKWYVNKRFYWNQYYNKIKKYIKKKIPVYTVVDPLVLPYFQKIWSLPKLGHLAHTIVITGIDEDRKLVFFHDPITSIYTSKNDGIHTKVDVVTFREAVSRANFWVVPIPQKFLILTFKKKQKPLEKKEAYKRSYKRNIERMKGAAGFYDSTYYHKMFKAFGINALKALKSHISNSKRFAYKNLYKIKYGFIKCINPFYFHPFKMITYSFQTISLEKKHMSDFINENKDRMESVLPDAVLLKEEADYWLNLADLFMMVEKHIKNKEKIDIGSIRKDMIDLIDKIINCEEKIIKETQK